MPPEFHLFLPQLRLEPDALVDRAQAAEAAGFDGIALIDHLIPPAAEGQPIFEAMTAATWLAACTDTLTVGHLVLCDAFRSPAVLARQVATLDQFSGGRFELAIGSGSTPQEFDAFGLGGLNQAERTARLGETLAVLRALWTGEVINFDGEYRQLRDARQLPTPTGQVPIIIGGTGPATMKLVAEYADWWNVPIHHATRLDSLRDQAGSARVSVQQVVTFVPQGGDSDAILAAAERRFGWVDQQGRVTGSATELIDHFGAQQERGIERFYLWFSDFAPPETVTAFGAEVITAFARSA